MELGGRFLTENEVREAGFRHVGKNVRIHSRASIYCPENISIGNNVRIDDFSIIIATGKVEIGDFVHIPNFCYLGATYGVVMEDFVTLAPGVKIFTSNDDYHGDKLTNPTIPSQFTGGRFGPVELKKHVIIGAGSVIFPDCRVNEGVSVGALSLVNTDLEPWGIYCGIPARRIKERKRDLLDLESKLREVKAHNL